MAARSPTFADWSSSSKHSHPRKQHSRLDVTAFSCGQPPALAPPKRAQCGKRAGHQRDLGRDQDRQDRRHRERRR